MKHLTDDELIVQTKNLVQQERELLTQVLDHLREISDRKLFSELGFKSLLEFAVKHLGYSESQAYRRITAMKLVRELPCLEEKIQRGEVHLNHIGLAQNLFRQEAKESKPFSAEQKLEVLNKMVGTSTREAKKITLGMSSKPESLRPEKAKPISETAVSLQVTVSTETLTSIETLKGWLAHRFPDMKTGELIEKLCELGLYEWNPSKSVKVRPKSNAPNKSKESSTPDTKDKVCIEKRETISASVRKQIFEKAGNRCNKCQSSYCLELDHRFPFALGGSSNPENLRVLCKNCNQRSAINAFGKEKILAHENGNSSGSRSCTYPQN